MAILLNKTAIPRFPMQLRMPAQAVDKQGPGSSGGTLLWQNVGVNGAGINGVRPAWNHDR